MSSSQAALIICSQFLIYSICWVVLASIVKNTRAAYFWSAYNALQACSFGFFDGVATLGSPALYAGIIFAILGYFCSSVGTDIFLHQTIKFKKYWVLYAVIGFFFLLASPIIGSGHAILLSLNLPAILFSLSGVIFFRSSLVMEFGKVGVLSIVPSALYGVFLLLTTTVRLVNDFSIGKYTESSSRFSIYIMVIIVVGILNTVFFSMYVSRLIISLRGLATTDSLTGLLNRREISREIENELNRSVRNDNPLSVAFVDIDYFKKINDLGGHDLGDYALKEVASTLAASLRSVDKLGRWGGEEFVLLMPETDSSGAYLVMERIHQNLKNRVILPRDKFSSLTVSIGVTSNANSSNLTLTDLIRNADHAMYDAKKSGRNKTIVFDEV
jgi:diguanylate cyclase (GGDEF)-like protein